MQTRFFGGSSSATSASLQAVTARNLQFLQAIDSTVDSLGSDSRLFDAIAAGFQEILERLQSGSFDQLVDPQGNIRDSLRRAAEATSRIHARGSQARQSACDDPDLHADDGVVEAFDQYLESVSAVHDLAEEICEWIEIQEASSEQSTGQVFSSVDELFKALIKG